VKFNSFGRRAALIGAVLAVVGLIRFGVIAADKAPVQLSEGKGVKYKIDENWRPSPPWPGPEWEVSAVTVSDDGSRVYATRRSDPPVLEIDAKSGRVLHEMSTGLLKWPHGIYYHKGFLWLGDESNSEVQWIGTAPVIRSAVENGRGYQVLKISTFGQPLLEIGTRGKQGRDASHFMAPCAVIVNSKGDVFVADGHGQHKGDRVVKFTNDGKYIKEWGKTGSGPGEFNGLHAFAIDAEDRLLVADRGNSRIQLFDMDGKFLTEWKYPRGHSGIAILPDGRIVGTTKDKLQLIDGNTGAVVDEIFEIDAEGVATDKGGNIYVAEVLGRRLLKLSPVAAR
jgi:DNA-binding beta-propeller fold protein YncE